MADWDEQLGYFVILSHLLREAGLQLAADAPELADHLYAANLDQLRSALTAATTAATAIVGQMRTQTGAIEIVPTPSAPVSRVTH